MEKSSIGVDVLVEIVVQGYQQFYNNSSSRRHRYDNYQFYHINELSEMKRLCHRLKGADVLIINNTLIRGPVRQGKNSVFYRQYCALLQEGLDH